MTFKDYSSTNKVKECFPEFIVSRKEFIPINPDNFEIAQSFEKEIKFGLRAFKPNKSYADRFLIAPIISKVWLKHEKLNLWSQPYLKVTDNLQGRPDYLISPLDRDQYEVLSLPIVVLVEAKHENFTLGWGQCLAEMIACQKLNISTESTIFGIVSTGQFWEFGKLQQNVFTKDVGSYSALNLQQTVNVVNYIFDQAELQIPKIDLSVVLPDIEQNNDENEQNCDEKNKCIIE
jgi:hypothetical protein